MTLPPDESSSAKFIYSDPVEVQRIAVYVERALRSEDAAGRRQALVEGLLSFGIAFVHILGLAAAKANNEQGPLAKLWEELLWIEMQWVSGESLTDRPDEGERRVQMAEALLKSQQKGIFEPFAARCLLVLPEGHPQRDITLAHSALLSFLEQSRVQKHVDNQLWAIGDLIRFKLESHDRTVDLIDEGRALAGGLPGQYQQNFRRIALNYYANLAKAAQDEGRAEPYREWSAKMHELFEDVRAAEPEFLQTAEGLMTTAFIMEISDRSAEAAALFASTVDASEPGDDLYKTAAVIESRYRMKLGEYERVRKILTPIIPMLEEAYLTAVEDQLIGEAGQKFSEATGFLAFAQANLNQWDEAIRTLERGKSLRLRYRAALRRSLTGQNLLELETKLYALARGVPVEGDEFDTQPSEDRLAAKVSLRSKVLESYRKLRPRLSAELLAAPALTDIARALEADEAVVIIGDGRRGGTLIAVICQGDEEQPAGRLLLKDWTFRRWAPFFSGEHADGWIWALAAPQLKIDRRPVLLRILSTVDEVIGQPLHRLLRERKVRRVTVVPHHLFHLVPFWALPSMEDYTVGIAASAAHFMQSRNAVEPAGRRALIVADPTRDLPASLAEAEAVTRHLALLDFDITRLDKEQATENAVVEALSGVSVFHFCGHGRSDLVKPDRSALLMSPQLNDTPTVGDPFLDYAAAAQDWQAEDNNRRNAVIPTFGRLYEKLDEEGRLQERRIEYGERGSLWGQYRNGRLERLAEMWTAGDILVDSPLGDCRLAFLSACEAGSGNIDVRVDEYSGLPAALQLAGAATIVCSLWPVGDALTALYVDLFYRTLTQAAQPVDVGSVVREVGLLLRRMTREQAVVLLNTLKQQTVSPHGRFHLEAFAVRVAAADEPYPFSHPYDWAAFYATGTSRILFTQGDAP